MKRYEQLLQLPIFQGVDPERIASLVEKIPFHFLKYADGEQIIAQGDRCAELCFVMSGGVTVTTPLSSEHIRLEQQVVAPAVLGFENMFGICTTHRYSAVAHESCGVMKVPKADFVQLMQADKVILFNILNMLSSGKQRELERRLAHPGTSGADRVVQLCAAFSIPGASATTLHFDNNELCDLVKAEWSDLLKSLRRNKAVAKATASQIIFT